MASTAKILFAITARLVIVSVASLAIVAVLIIAYLPIIFPELTWEQRFITAKYLSAQEVRIDNPGNFQILLSGLPVAIMIAYYFFKFKRMFPDGNLYKRKIIVYESYNKTFEQCISATKLIKKSIILNQDIKKGKILIKFRHRFMANPFYISFELKDLDQNVTGVTIQGKRFAYLYFETPHYLKTIEDFLVTERRFYF
jgi:hypothetical protein